MIRNLVKHGSGFAVVIDKAILELLKISPTRPIDISTDGKSLILTPLSEGDAPKASTKLRKDFMERVERLDARYADVLKLLN